jgi:hypothetical protein
VTREDALAPLQEYLEELLDAPGIPPASGALFRALLGRVASRVDAVARGAREHLARQAASALYHVTSAIIMAWEAARQAPDSRRLVLAHLVARYRLLPVGPLADGPVSESLARESLPVLPDFLAMPAGELSPTNA